MHLDNPTSAELSLLAGKNVLKDEIDADLLAFFNA